MKLESTILLFLLLETVRDFGNVIVYKINIPVSVAFLHIKSNFFRKYNEKCNKRQNTNITKWKRFKRH